MGERKFAKYAFACISAEHLDKDGNLNVSVGEDKLVVNWGWFWKDEESEQYRNALVSGTNGECVADYNGEKVRITEFEPHEGMIYSIPGNGVGYVVSGITSEDYEKFGYTHIHVYYAGQDFKEAERVYDELAANKDEYFVLDLLSGGSHKATKSTRRKFYEKESA